MGMKPGLQCVLFLAGCLAAPGLAAQGQVQNQPADQSKAQKSSQPAPQAKGNPFPENESSVPLMPSGNSPDLTTDMNGERAGRAAAPASDSDPVRSPDDAMSSDSGATSGFSSSQSGLDNLIPPPDTEPTGKKKKKEDDSLFAPMPRENPKEDVDVGNYYMDNHDWKGALSRFESALVLAPDNPDVYWGLAECERHLGQYAAARENYLKVMEYDPGSRHAKEAKKALKDPEIANAKPSGQAQK